MFIAKAFPDGLSSMSKVCQNSKTLCCLQKRTTFSNMTRFGVLCSKSSINAGCGRCCAVELAKSLPFSSVIGAKPPVAVCGRKFPLSIVGVFPSVIFGMPTRKFFHRKLTMRLARKVDRLHIWNAGIVRCVNARLVMSAKLFRFQSATLFITW